MSGRRKRKDRHHYPLAAALLGQCDEIAEAEQAAARAARPKRPRFDPEGRRLARIHTLYRAGRGADSGKVLPLIRLSGSWLQETGFPIGQRYSVEVRDGELVIRAV